MDLGIFGKLIENVAPTIATALGGPVAGMACVARIVRTYWCEVAGPW